MECRVEFDYTAQEADELTIKKGEIIKNVVTKMDGWFEGTLKGKTGVFPDNFVKLLEKPVEMPENTPKPAEVVLRNNPSSARRVKVLFSYAPEQDDELTLDVGDVVDFLEEVEEGWWRGKLKGKEGIFPSNFVQNFEEGKTNGSLDNGKPEDVMQKDVPRSNQSHAKGIGIPDVVPSPQNQSIDEPAPQLPPKPVRELARCFYQYKALNEDELSLSEGDIITIISRQCEDEGWWRGELRGKIGLFPDNFVKIITPGEIQPTGTSNGPQQKLLAQERNVVHAAAPNPDPSSNAKRDSISGIGGTVVDGGGISKATDKDTSTSAASKVEQTKAKLNKSGSKESPLPPKVGHVVTSPGIAAFHTNLFSNQKPDTFLRRDTSVSKDDKQSDESEEFNSVEKTETLNHLTANRAKAPKRRPPSTVIARENDVPMMNGSSHSYDSSLADSPPPHHSTPNSSVTSNGTQSGSFLEHSGSFLAQSRDKESSPTPSNPANNISASKPKKQALPWMAELKQTQDKKRGLVSPGAPPATAFPGGPPALSSTPPVTTSSSSQSPQTAVTKDLPAKAPPLPAKPSTLAMGAATGQDKTYNNLNHSSSFGSSNKPFPKKSPSPAPPATSTTTTNHNSSMGVSSTDGLRGDGDGNSNKGYVPYDEYAALKSRVTSLESEVEHLKRQIKILMDRDLRGHIV